MPSYNLFQSEFERAIVDRIDTIESAVSDVDSAGHSRSFVATISLEPTSKSERDPAANEQAAASDEQFDVFETRRHLVKTERGDLWIVGDAILCECPDCTAPMTIRSWLGLADCWRCSASTKLSSEQIEAIESFQQEQLAPQQVSPDAERAAVTKRPQATSADPIVVPNFDAEPVREDAWTELDRLTRESLAANIVRRGFSAIPAWLLSFLMHLMLLLLLALFVFSSASNPPTITLSTFVSPDKKEGGEVRIENPEHSLADDLMMANDMEVDVEEIRDVLQQAKSDAEELTQNDAPTDQLPDLDEVKKNVSTSRDELMSFAARDPRVRSEIVVKEGGTSFTEAAVSRGLRWLAQVQNKDGSWSLANYSKSGNPRNKGDAAGTALALLPFLGAGQTHEFGVHRKTVAKGLAWLLDNQKESGDLRINFPGQAGMYAHGHAAIVLCEAFAMTGDQRFKEPAQKAIRFIENSQHRQGGWRYRPKQAGDTSVLGWQLMAIQSARAADAGIEVDPSTIKLADYYLDQAVYRGRGGKKSTRNLPTGSLYTYQSGEGRVTAPMTAEAILCRMYLGWTRDDPRVIEAIRWLVEHNMPSERDRNVYYWYYATQVMHHYGGEVWELWNRKMREILVSGQTTSGRNAGSWNPKGYEWGDQGGRIYVTSLSVCTLEVYYRHLPIFKQIELDGSNRISTSVDAK